MSLFCNSSLKACQRPSYTRPVKTGFTLIEMLLCLTMLALIMLPFTAVMSTTANASRGAYLQSTRTLMLNSLKGETTPTDPNYVSNFTDGSMNTSISDTGQTMPFRRSVDATTTNATNSFKRTTLFYLYKNTTDASSAPYYKATVINYPKVLRMHFGTSPGIIDTLGRYWYSDSASQLLYDATHKVPGWTATHSTSNNSNDILNTAGNDDKIYEPEVDGSNISYNVDVENGAYTVKIYTAEVYSGITASNRRLFDFYLEGVRVNPEGPYSALETTGGLNRAMLLMYDTNVTDGTLNFNCTMDSLTNDTNCNIHAIEIIKRSK